MRWQVLSNWPPPWAGIEGRPGGVTAQGEVGVLTKVEITKALPRPALTLTIDHLGNTPEGVLYFHEEEIIPRLFEILKGCEGWPITRIGSLDVDL